MPEPVYCPHCHALLGSEAEIEECGGKMPVLHAGGLDLINVEARCHYCHQPYYRNFAWYRFLKTLGLKDTIQEKG